MVQPCRQGQYPQLEGMLIPARAFRVPHPPLPIPQFSLTEAGPPDEVRELILGTAELEDEASERVTVRLPQRVGERVVAWLRLPRELRW